MILRLRSAISFFTYWCFLISTVSAATDNIGFVITSGEVQVDGIPVPGNAAIFSGSRLASGNGISNLRFSDGTTAVMRPSVQMTVYREHSVLLRGVIMQRGADKHAVIADGLRISGATRNAVVLIGVKDESHFEVAAEGGGLEVRTSTGNLVARVKPGRDLSFTMSQAPAGTQNAAVQICGPLPGNAELTDTFTSVTYRLQGTALEPFHGKTVVIIGTVANPSSTPPIVDVSSIKEVRSCEVAAGPGAAPAATSITSGKGLILVSMAMAGLGAAIYFSVNSGITPTAPTLPPPTLPPPTGPPPVTPSVP